MSDYNPPPRPPPAYANGSGAGKPQGDDFAPPPGPPPSAFTRLADNDPFSRRPRDDQDYTAPPGPPPSAANPQHDWQTAVPDTSLLPPPPAFFTSLAQSPVNNATGDECAQGEQWCSMFKLYRPIPLDKAAHAAIAMGNINLFTRPDFQGSLTNAGVGIWRVKSKAKNTDTCISSYPPLYSPHSHMPSDSNPSRRIYYEVNISSNNSSREIDLAIGYTAPPYPPFRLPGWHRGSLAVHGDDGNRFVNDDMGGQSFTQPFQRGETVGLGMDLSRGAGGQGVQVVVFFTRNGQLQRKWNLYEETDAEHQVSLEGLQGRHDLCAAIGLFNEVQFEVVFAPAQWRWQGFHSDLL